MDNLFFTINAVAPVFILILLGAVFKKIKLINESFVSISSQLVFRVTLPSLVFIKLSTSNFRESFNQLEIIIIIGGILFSFFLAWILSSFFVHRPYQKGAFIQGSFRGNVSILGLAIMFNVFGDTGLARGAILIAFIMPLFNILSVIALTLPLNKGKSGAYNKIAVNLIKNPLIIAVLLGLLFSLLNLRLFSVFSTTVSYLSAMTLPLALLGIGGSLSFQTMKEHLSLSLIAASLKVLVSPIAVGGAAWFAGLRGESLGVVFIVFGCPTAIASFIMAKEMGSDSHLAANIILVTTIASVVTIGGGIFILKSFGLI